MTFGQIEDRPMQISPNISLMIWTKFDRGSRLRFYLFTILMKNRQMSLCTFSVIKFPNSENSWIDKVYITQPLTGNVKVNFVSCFWRASEENNELTRLRTANMPEELKHSIMYSTLTDAAKVDYVKYHLNADANQLWISFPPDDGSGPFKENGIRT